MVMGGNSFQTLCYSYHACAYNQYKYTIQ